jgi:broad specificity phosphatase PhoE
MRRILLIRHAQASFGEDNYDRLSPLGHDQADRLGLYLKPSTIDCLVSGALVRHQETVQAILRHQSSPGRVSTSRDWDEFDHREVFFAYRPDLMEATAREAWRASLGAAYDHTVMAVYREALLQWMMGALTVKESWQDFTTRVKRAWAELQRVEGSLSVVVTSAGPLSVLLGEVEGWKNDEIAEWQTSLWNSGVSELRRHGGGWGLQAFNTCPHLEGLPDWITQK